MPANAFDDALVRLPKSANPFDGIVGEMKQARTGAVSVAVEDAAKKNPDQQAEYIRMADQLRVPLSVIERNPDAYKGAAALHQNDFDSLLRDTPRLAQHLTEKPEFAAVAHDDLPALGAMEKSLAVAENSVRELGAGLYRGATSGLFGMIEGAAARAMDAADQPTTARSLATSALELQGPQLFGQIAGRERASAIQQWAQAHRQAAQATVETIKGPQTGAARLERGIYSGIESVGLMAPGLLTAVATKNPSVALAIMGGQTTGEAYGQAADQGASATKAGIFATIQGAIEVGTEALPLQWLIKDLGAGSGFLKTLAHQVFSENIGEQAATVLQDLAEWKFLPENQNKGWQDYAAARPGAALDTLVATVASVGATTGIATGAHKLITGLGQAATQSKTQKRSPEAVESFIAQATKDSPAKAVYAPVETWTTYWQSKGEDPAAMAMSLTGDPQAYQKAIELGTDLEIPIAKYAAKLAGTEHNAFFANELKLDPAEMNAREAAAHVESLRQQQEAAQPAEPAQPSTLDQATDLMTQRMVEQGIPQDTAQTYGAIWRAGIGTLASNFGIDPLALQAQYGPQGGPTITRQGMEPAPTPTPTPVPAEAPPDGTPEGVPVEAPTPEPQTPDTILQLRQQLSASQAERRTTERNAEIDPLTGLGNGRALSKALPAAEADPNTSVLFFDANNFGQINKATGSHEAGDAKLKEMAAALRQAATEAGIGDRVFRRAEGGDEFVILAPNDVAAQVRQRAEALFGAHQYVDKQGQPFEVSLTGTEGATVADAEGALQAAKAARKSPLGPANAQGERALFLGMQETGTDEPPIPTYRVQGGPHDNAGATQDELRQWGIPIPQVGQTTLKQEQRGEIRFGADRQFNITLLERADLSTFLHETGHFFLEVFGDLTDQLAQREGATLTPEQQRLQTDHAALLQWLGVDSRAQIGREQHEQFARGFEAYLMEGKAPSLELRSAFARARAWLLGIYKSLRNLNVTLTPEVRGIFDRLLASDAAIQQAQQTASVSGMFLNAESAGMSEAQFASYRGDIEDASRKAKEELDRQILAEVQREQTATWKAQRDAIKEQVTTEVQQQPVYRALAAMQKGTHPNGEPLIEGETTDPLKLSKTIISERYGPERLKSLPKPYIYSREGGLDPDTVAEMFGFSSGDALLSAVSTAPSMRSVIERETAGRMFQQHGSLLLDGTLGEKAQAAVANDSREEVIRAELKALHTLQRKGAATLRATIPSMTAIRQAARERIAGTRYGDIKPQTYWAAGLRTGRQAVELAAQQKFSEAVAAKQQQLFNLALYREAIAQRTDMDRRVAAARELDSPKSRARIGLAGGTFQDQIDGILDQYEFARVSQKALDRRADLRKWIAALEGEGFPVELPAELLEQTRRINYRELTVEQLIGVTDGLKQIVHLARLKNKLLKSQAQREFTAVRDDVSASIYEHGTVRPRQLEIGQREQTWRSVSDWYASHVKLADLAQSMDGGQEGGPMWEAFVRPVNDAANAEETRSREAGKAYAALLEQHYPGRELGRLSEKREIRAINGSLSKEAILAIAQNQGTDSNKARLLTDSYRNFTEPQIRAILDTLDQRDWDFVQAHFDYLETYWSEIAAKMKRVTGVEPEKVPATPIVTKFGTYRGGYHPLVADTRLSPAAAQHDLATQAKLGESAAYLRTTTRRGHEQARVEHADYPVRLELGVTFKHLSQVIHDLTHHEMLIDTTRLLRDPKVRQAIVETQGDIVYSKFSRWLQDIALGDTAGGGKPTIADKAATFMRTRTQVMAMAYNLWTAMQQPLGIFNGMSRVGGTDGASSGVYWVSKGMSRWLRDAGSMENTVAWIRDASPMMAGRFGNETGTQDLRDLRASFSQSGGWFDSLLRTVTLDHLTQQALMNSFLWHIGMAQRVADVPTWLGMYEKQMAKGETEDRAIALADQAVIDSQGGGQVKDLAEIQRGGPVAKLFMSFASYGVTVLNANARATRQTNFRSASSALSFLGHLTLLNVMPALGLVAMRQALFGGRGGDDDESWATWIESVGAEMLSSSLNGIIFVRELSGAAQLALGLDTTGGRGYGGPAGMRAMKLTYDLATQIHQGEADAAAGKAALGVTGFLLKFPSTQIQKTVDGWVAMEEGRTSNPVALVVGPPPKGQ